LDDVIVLACDGLWDVLSSSEAIKHAREIFLSGEMDMQLVAEDLIDIAFGKGKEEGCRSIGRRKGRRGGLYVPMLCH